MTLPIQTIHTSGFNGLRNDQILFSILTGIITVKYPWDNIVDEKSTHLERLSVGQNGPEMFLGAVNGKIWFKNVYPEQNPLPFL